MSEPERWTKDLAYLFVSAAVRRVADVYGVVPERLPVPRDLFVFLAAEPFHRTVEAQMDAGYANVFFAAVACYPEEEPNDE